MSEMKSGLIDSLTGLELEKADILRQIAQRDEAMGSLSAQKEAAVADFDNQIDAIRAEQSHLLEHSREVEAQIGSITMGSVIAELASSPEEWSKLWYERLKVLWAYYDVQIPTYENLEEKLVQAREIINQIESEDPTLSGEFGPILVPPSDTKLDMPVKYYLRDIGDEYKATVSENWRVLVTLVGEQGVNCSAEKLINQKKYMMAGYDTRQLGVTEYIALVHQAPHFKFHHYQKGIISLPVLDRASSTLLLKNYHVYKGKTWEGRGVMEATYDDGRYQIKESFIDWEKGYRPTVEV
jgi:hypothetical protein